MKLGFTIAGAIVVLIVSIISIIRQRRGIQDKGTTVYTIGGFSLVYIIFLIVSNVF